MGTYKDMLINGRLKYRCNNVKCDVYTYLDELEKELDEIRDHVNEGEDDDVRYIEGTRRT